MKHVLALLCSLVLVSEARALSTIYGYDYSARKHASEYLQLVDRNSPAEGAPSCQPMYKSLLRDDVLDIRYALGYFDDSTGQEQIWNGVNWGYSPSLDIAIYEAMIATLTKSCSSSTMRVCGFSPQGVPSSGRMVFHKYMNFEGRNILVRITLTQASASESFERNKGELAERQHFLTAQSEHNFFDGLKMADIVFYNGHSRNGGGPDFNPPILNSHKKTDYDGYYEVKRPGIKHVMASLSQNPDKDVIVGFFSCYARLHFYKTFMNANPNQRVILSSDTINYFDAFEGSLGYLEGLLRGSCGSELDKTAKQLGPVERGFQSFNFR